MSWSKAGAKGKKIMGIQGAQPPNATHHRKNKASFKGYYYLPSSHNHGSEKWIPLRVVTFHFSTIMRERVTTIVGVPLDSHSKKMAQNMEAWDIW